MYEYACAKNTLMGSQYWGCLPNDSLHWFPCLINELVTLGLVDKLVVTTINPVIIIYINRYLSRGQTLDIENC